MARWIYCRRCEPNITSGVVGWPAIPNECPGCNILFIQLTFKTEAIGDLIVGAGNHHSVGDHWQTDTWVLFYESGDYNRAASRPVDCSVTTFPNPADGTQELVDSISVASGAFVWTRASHDPMDPGYNLFELTAGTINVPVCDCGECVSIDIVRHRTPFAWADPVEDWVADITVPAGTEPPCAYGDECTEDMPTTICLHFDSTYTGWSGPVDGWGFGGRWIWDDVYDGTVDGFGNHFQCTEAATLTISGFILDECTDQENGEFVASNLCCEISYEWDDCDRDPRTPPTEAEFSIELSNTCDGSLDSLSYGGSCSDPSDTTINCPPTDCPITFCKWHWNVDTLVWDFVSSGCTTGYECPDPPPDPTITDVGWYECLCCIPTAPTCPPGKTACATPSCVWVWNAGFSLWLGSACPSDPGDLTCTCQGMPSFAGLFNGQTVDGICCRAV